MVQAYSELLVGGIGSDRERGAWGIATIVEEGGYRCMVWWHCMVYDPLFVL